MGRDQDRMSLDSAKDQEKTKWAEYMYNRKRWTERVSKQVPQEIRDTWGHKWRQRDVRIEKENTQKKK